MNKSRTQLTDKRLAKVQINGPGFEVPENYFDTVEDNVMAIIGLSQLDDAANISPFQTPKNYFNAVEDTIHTQLKPQKKNKPIIKYMTWFSPIAVAATLVLIFVLNNKNADLSFENLATSEIEYSIENGNLDIDYTSLLNMFDDMDIDIETSLISISDQDLESYLYNENMESIIDEYY